MTNLVTHTHVYMHYTYMFQQPPAVSTGRGTDVEAESEGLEHDCWQSFSEYVRILKCCWNMKNMDFSKSNTIMQKVQINVHVLGALMLDQIVGEVHNTDVVTVNHCGFR